MNLVIILIAKYLYLAVLGTAALIWLAQPHKSKWTLAINGLVAGIMGPALTKLAGTLYYDPRPFVAHHLTPLITHVADNGFPSDHTVLTMIAALTIFQVSRLWGIALIIASLLVGGARVAARIHSPIDILAAVVIAIGAVLAARAISPWILKAIAKKAMTRELV
jgi:membrane-associated phospholipid phosphatase